MNHIGGLLGKLEVVFLQVGPEYFHIHNIAEHDIRILIIKWWNASQQLIDENAKCPPVHILIMALAHKHLGSHVLRRATYGIAKLILLREAKVGQLNVSMLIKYNILRFEVAILDVEFVVEVADG